jgi:hypothetical protein
VVESESDSSALTSLCMRIFDEIPDDAVLLVSPGAMEILDMRIEGAMIVVEYRVVLDRIALTFSTSFQQEKCDD